MMNDVMLMCMMTPHAAPPCPDLACGTRRRHRRLLSMAQASGLLREGLTGLTLRQFLAMHLAQCSAIPGADVDDITAELAARGTERRLPPGARVFSWGDQPDSFFLVLKVRGGWCLNTAAV
jgi:hypothetical protein